MDRGITLWALCVGWLGIACAQNGVSPESRKVRTAKPAGEPVPAEVVGTNGPQAAASSLVAEPADYTKLLEQFLKANDEQTDVYFFHCKYIAAETMRRLLENFLTPAGTVGRSDEDDIVVVSDLPSRMPQLKQIIEQADQPVAQVLVEARIVELEVSNELVRDVNMGIAKTGASDSVRKIFQDILVPGTSASAGTEKTDDTFSAGKRADGSLWTFVGIDQVKIWAMINYLEQKGRARILSSPNLVIRRGADGNIMNGEKIPVLERTITGSSESISTRFENVGVKLIVRPLMISGKRIHVKVNPEVSSAPRTVQTGDFETPVIVVRSASTQLEANDGELITIGGLMREEQRVLDKRVPYLADIPYLGVLFRSKQIKTFTSQIVIFMTMRLVEPGAYDALAAQRQDGAAEKIREQVKSIEDTVDHDSQAIWKELPK